MASNSQDPSRKAAAHGQGPSGDWRQERVGSPVEGRRVIQAVLSAMTGQGYAEAALTRVRQVLEESLASALWYSQSEGADRHALVRYQVTSECVLAEVEGRGGPAGAQPLQGPHMLGAPPPAPGEAPFRSRSYTWLRCARRDTYLDVCTCRSTP